MSVWFDLNHQEFAVLATALALLGFSVVAAILLMRTRVAPPAPKSSCAPTSRICRRGRPVARAAVRRTAGSDLLGCRRQPSRRSAATLAVDARQTRSTTRRNASWLSEPGCRRNRRCRWIMRSTRCARPAKAFCSISPPRPAAPSKRWAAPSAARPSCGFANSADCAANSPKSNLRYKTLQEETETAARLCRRRCPGRSGPSSADGELRYANAAYAQATEAASVADAIERNLELLDSDDRDRDGPGAERQLELLRAAADRGRRRAAHLRRARAQGQRRQRRHRDRRQRSDRAARRTGADGGGASPHARPAVLRRRRVRCPAPARLLQRFLSPAVGSRSGLPRRQSRRFQRARPAARRAQTAGAAGLPGLEGEAARGLSRGRTRPRIPGICPTAAPSASSRRRIPKAASPICSTTSPKASIWRAGSTG